MISLSLSLSLSLNYTMYVQVLCGMAYRVYYIDQLVDQFTQRFNTYYTAAVATDFASLSLPAQVDYVKHLLEVKHPPLLYFDDEYNILHECS